MEEAKVIDPPESFEGVFWQWQSCLNPWAEKDPAQRTWQDYSYDDCRIIEKALSLKKEIAHLKEYEVDLKKMLQVNKKDRHKIRRVRRARRQEKSRFMMEMSEPVAIVKDQKTMNDAFGTIQQFLNYITKRTREAYELYQELQTLSLEAETFEFEDIVNKVIVCIEKGAEVREKIIKTRSPYQPAHFLTEAKKIIIEIKASSAILGDFLKTILKIYTMESFICYWLNELLRSEDWEEMNVLTPYLVCLVYTFKRSEFIIPIPQGLVGILRRFVGKQKLYLYRGTALTQEHLDLYKSEKMRYFSWNGVTSTSRDKGVAFGFLNRSLSESKVGVLFQIETDFASSVDCEGMIDVSKDSEYPREQEVILSPGTVFKLLKIQLNESGIYEINLEVIKKFEETEENIALLGDLQERAISKDKATIDGLPSQQSLKLLEMLMGNKLIQELEIRNSIIENHILEEIENLRVSTNIKREGVKLTKNTFVIRELSLFLDYFSSENLYKLMLSNEIQFQDGIPKKNLKLKDEEMQTVILNEEAFEIFQRNNQLKDLGEKVKQSSRIRTLDLSIREISSTDDEFISLLAGKIESGSLQSFGLKVSTGRLISRESFERVCKAIRYSHTLKRVYLEFTLSYEELESSQNALALIGSVQNLSLGIKFSRVVGVGGLNHLMNSLKSFISLQYLSLDFAGCHITDEGLNHLQSRLIHLTSLQKLSLDFAGYDKISDKGLNYLVICFIPLNKLQRLSLDFAQCKKISDEGLNHLKSGFFSLKSLQHLSLNFSGTRISGKVLYDLKSDLKFIPNLNCRNF